MKQYYKIIEGKTVFFKEPLIVDGMQIFNPSEELILAAGWQEYIPPTPEPIDTTIYEPDEYAIVEKLKQLAQAQVSQQTDEEALENIELFPTWQSKFGVPVQQGERLYYDDKLYKVQQTHTPQDDWRPDATASLYVQVVADDSGTESNPTPYQVGLELIEGKYYTEEGVKYRCIRSLAQSVWHLADLVGNYVEVIA